MKKCIVFLLAGFLLANLTQAQDKNPASASPNDILLKNYRPKSIYHVPVTRILRASYPVIDMHSHPYVKTRAEIRNWIKAMDSCNIRKTIILTGSSGARFDSIADLFSPFMDRFELWCGFDYTGYDKPGFGPAAVKELERCYRKGARGVGELGDKGLGELYSYPVPGLGLHPDDPRMKPLWNKCAELKLPVNIHVADPIWMYEPMDSTNDGLMNAFEWKIDFSKPGLIGFDGLMDMLERVVKDNPKVTFIACHFANLSHDLDRLGKMLDRNPNLYADISARYAESAPVPRYTASFYARYKDRLLYGTDMGTESDMYRTTFRILESNDEHFYAISLFGYHWPLYGLGLPSDVLKKVYQDNARKILENR